MKSSVFIAIFIAALSLSCSKKQEAASTTTETPQKEAKAETIKISAEQFKNLHLELGNLQQTPINDEVKSTGMVDVPPENVASVSVFIPGFIKSISHNHSLPGQFVSKGTVLATVEGIEFIQMQQDYLQALAQNGFLAKELERQQTLNAEDIGAKKKLQQAESEFNSNQALVKSLEAKLKMLGINPVNLKKQDISPVLNIYAPISGFIKSSSASIGKSVAPNDVLFEIVSKEHLHIELKVLEKDAFKIEKGQKVLVEEASLGNKLVGTVFLVGKAFEGEAKSINVHVHIDNEQQEQKLIPGMFINAKIMTGTRTTSTLPESALLREAEGTFVLILDKQDNKEVSFKKVPVRTGISQQGNIAVELPENYTTASSIVIKNGHFLASMGTEE
ncbi:efflux RND transporter periplasmic adaptor subunit [Emticicia sp. 17c]|uniref:efflux RND transporter periplasmic adaptor subunit n=1 Tax=Emticicia sp. 17c TaxID=3127704 RepID=UPI00301DCB27